MSHHVLTRDGVVVYDYTDPACPTVPVDPPPHPVDPPPSGNYETRQLKNPLGSFRDTYVNGQVYAFPISAHGGVSFSNAAGPGNDGNRNILISLSDAPGDMSKAVSPGTVCGGVFGTETASIGWGVGYYNRCQRGAGYMNVQVTNGPTGELIYSWNPN